MSGVRLHMPHHPFIITDQCAEGGLLPVPINLGVFMDFCVFSRPINATLDAGVPPGAAGMPEYIFPPVGLSEGGVRHPSAAVDPRK